MQGKVEVSYMWSEFFKGLVDNEKEDHTIKIQLEHFSGTARQVADRARTTIGLEPGDKVITPQYMRKLYLCEHSPIRIQQYLIRIEGIPYSTAMHFVRHHVGVIPFVSTGRDDRVDISEQPTRDRDRIPVYMELMCNPQAIIDISRRRLCSCSHINTIKVWKAIRSLMSDLNPPLAAAMVKDCVYRGHCYEHKTCGYHYTTSFDLELAQYRESINGSKKSALVRPKDIIRVKDVIGTVYKVFEDLIVILTGDSYEAIKIDNNTEIEVIGRDKSCLKKM